MRVVVVRLVRPRVALDPINLRPSWLHVVRRDNGEDRLLQRIVSPEIPDEDAAGVVAIQATKLGPSDARPRGVARAGAGVKQHRRYWSRRREILDRSRQAAKVDVSLGFSDCPFPGTVPEVPTRVIACQFQKQPGPAAVSTFSLCATGRRDAIRTGDCTDPSLCRRSGGGPAS